MGTTHANFSCSETKASTGRIKSKVKVERKQSDSQIDEMAGALLIAEDECKAIPPLTSRYGDMQVEDAYRIQMRNVEAKKKRGRTVVGKKAGLTSEAIQKMFDVDEPDYGHLFDDMIVASGVSIDCSRLIQPKAEPEIGFLLAKELRGPGITADDVFRATSLIAPTLEIIDSRIENWKIRLADTISDNASSGMVVLGAYLPISPELDLKEVEARLEKNGKLVSSGPGRAVLGDPAHAVAWLANKLSTLGESLKPGELILPGSFCAAVDARPGDVIAATFTGLGTVTVRFT